MEFAERVVALMRQHQVPPGQLQLEITESLLLERSAVTEHNLEMLVNAGARIVIDDFGTGYTSFNQLRDLPIHGIKLDRLFVRELPDNEDDAAIVAALIAMAKQLQLDIVAEGVETEAQRDFLVLHGCPSGQGWLFGRPAPL
jgi:EAL domain-containing protein (putative c-di-GMP-specific phosphodiesterase class I)